MPGYISLRGPESQPLPLQMGNRHDSGRAGIQPLPGTLPLDTRAGIVGVMMNTRFGEPFGESIEAMS